jgi:hypothetical protein
VLMLIFIYCIYTTRLLLMRFPESSTSSRRTLPQSATCGGRPCLLSAVATRYVCYIKDIWSCNNVTTLFSFGTVFWYSLSQCMCVNFQLRMYSIHSSLSSNSGVTHFTLHPSGENADHKTKNRNEIYDAQNTHTTLKLA